MGEKAELQAEAESKAIIEQKWVHRGKFIQVRTDIVSLEGAPPKIWDLIIHPGAVAIVPVNDRGEVILVEQWRRAVGKILIELPAGLLDPGEDPMACAQRELQEEIGYKAGKLTALGGCYAAPGISNEFVHLFIAKELEESRLVADDTEVIDLRIVTLKEALGLIENGTICDAKTIVGLLRYREIA